MEEINQQTQSNQETQQMSQGSDVAISQIPSLDREEKNKKVVKVLTYVLASIFLVATGVFGFWAYQKRLTGESTPILTPTSTPPTKFFPQKEIEVFPSPTPTQKNYEEGVILVTFNDGTTYKEAKDLLLGMNLQIEGTNSYWKAQNFQPNESTELKKIDLFKIGVPVGKEDEIRDQLMQHSIVRAASKNFIGHID